MILLRSTIIPSCSFALHGFFKHFRQTCFVQILPMVGLSVMGNAQNKKASGEGTPKRHVVLHKLKIDAAKR
jgi:hypothetical protein